MINNSLVVDQNFYVIRDQSKQLILTSPLVMQLVIAREPAWEELIFSKVELFSPILPFLFCSVSSRVA